MESKIKFLVLAPYYPPHIGGLESHAHEFNIQASHRGYEVMVWTSRLPKNALEIQEIDSIKIVRYPTIELLGGFPIPALWSPSFWKQYREISNQNYTLIVSRTRFFVSSFLALLYAKKRNIPLLHIEHGSDYVHLAHRLATSLAYLYDQIIGRVVLQASDMVVANSHASAQFVTRLTGNAVHPAVIYRGVNEQIIKSAVVHQHASDTVVICYTGRLISGKGVQDLILALSQLPHTKFSCWIIGDGPMKKELEQLSEHYNLAHKVTFLGQMDSDKALSYINSCDIFVNPSYTEGIPTSVIEAALCKKAIIATNVGGTNEIIIHNKSGILITPHSNKELADALMMLIGNTNLRQELGEHAYAQNTSKFSWERAMNEYEKIFR